MRNYSYFEYRKILITLNQLKISIENISDYYYIEIDTFEEGIGDYFKSFDDFAEKDVIDLVSNFPLIGCGFYVGEIKSPIIVFVMEGNICKLNFYLNMAGVKNKKFEVISSAVDIENMSWEYLLTAFIDKINLAIKGKLKIKYDSVMPPPCLN